ncbi:hypothetical protein [Nocardioides panacisoli]|uniref:YfhO family protein n=1 Tax=Nocardioides panacisoli TaxID=627624 RepID=A0ABP7IMV3_9ACTN
MRRLRSPVSVDLCWTLLLAVAILLPLFLGPGTWLLGDMVFVPHQPWKAAWLGLDDSLPRAVPMDALVSLATYVVSGAWLQRILLTGGLLLAGLGTGRVLARHAWYARAAGIALFVWNPWVLERLLIGQWAILLGYLLLPWVALAARRLRTDPRSAWGPAALALAASAVCSPSSGVMAVVVLAVLGLTRDRAGWWRLGVVAVVANLPWLAPTLTATSVHISTDGVFAGFAARAESGAGVLASLLTLGGIWKTSIVPDARGSAALVLLSLLLTLAALAGLRRAVRDEPGEWPRWLLLGAGALVVALVPALPGGSEALEWAAARVPGLALLRDSHRFLAPLGLVLALGAGGAATAVRERVRPGRGALWSVVGLLVVAPVLLLPSLAWGAAGELQRSSYPRSWSDVADLLDEDPGTTVVLPWAGSYRSFAWDHRRAVLDPAPRFFPGEVLIDDRIYLDDVVVPSEDPRVADVGRALGSDDPAGALQALGVRWVLVEEGTGAVAVPDGGVRYDDGGLRLVDLGAPAAGPPTRSKVLVALVTLVDTLFVLLIFNGIRSILRSGSNRRHSVSATAPPTGPGEDRGRRTD